MEPVRIILFVFLSLTFFFSSKGQSPGNVGTGNLKVWLKADAGIASTPIGTWTDQSPNTANATQATAAKKPTLTTNAINYNPAVTFSAHALQGTKGNYSNDYYIVILPNASVSAASGFQTVFVSNDINTSGLWTGAFTGALTNEIITHNNTGTVKSAYCHATNSFSGVLLINCRHTAAGTGQELYVNGKTYAITQAGSWASYSNVSYDLGNRTSDYGTPYAGKIAEFIEYSVRNTDNDRKKISSYLAFKYGITMDNTGMGSNYYNSALTSIYTDAGTYWNEIIAIGKDNNTGLLQKQAKTLTDTTRLYVNTLAATNQTNAGTITTDASYVVAGNNQGKMFSTSTSLGERPAGIYSQLEREWKVTNTGFSDSYSMDFILDAMAQKVAPDKDVCMSVDTTGKLTDALNAAFGTKNSKTAPGLTAVTASDLRLLVDGDGVFTDATVVASGASGITITYSAPTITVSGLSTTLIPLNSTRYLTIASANVATPLPIELLNFNAAYINNAVTINWETTSEINNDYFTIEKTNNGTDFEEVKIVKGAGNSHSNRKYSALDESPYPGQSYYRLKQTDLNGKSTYSNQVPVQLTEQKIAFSIFPNPLNNENLYIRIKNADVNVIHIMLYNTLGNICFSKTVVSNNRDIDIPITPTVKLNRGIYLIEVISGNQNFTGKLIIN